MSKYISSTNRKLIKFVPKKYKCSENYLYSKICNDPILKFNFQSKGQRHVGKITALSPVTLECLYMRVATYDGQAQTVLRQTRSSELWQT